MPVGTATSKDSSSHIIAGRGGASAIARPAETSFASSRTRRCCEIAANVIRNGSASSLAVAAYSFTSLMLSARRVTNAAANSTATIRSKASGKTKKYLAMMAP
jgi:hypothetical protein